MLLRRSGEKSNQKYNLNAIVDNTSDDVGVAHETFLLNVADAVFRGDEEKLAQVRLQGCQLLGEQALVDAIAVACGFNGITKIANATGLPLDADTHTATSEMREKTKIDNYSDAHKAQRFC